MGWFVSLPFHLFIDNTRKSPRSDQTVGPVVARSAGNMWEGVVNERVAFGLIFSLTQVCRWAFNFVTSNPGMNSSTKQS